MPQNSPMHTHWPRIALLWLCGLAAAMQFAKVSLGFDDLLAFYAVTPAQLGWSLSIVGMSGLLFGVTAGLFAHAVGFRRLLLMGLGLGAVLSLLQTLMLPYPLFFITRLLEGVSHLVIIVIAPILITANSAPQHRSITIGLWSTFFGAAFALTSLCAPSIVAHFGVRGLLVAQAMFISMMWLLVRLTLKTDGHEQDTCHLPKISTLFRQNIEVYQQFKAILPGLSFMCYTATSVSLMTFIPKFVGDDRAWLAPLLPVLSILGTFSAGWLAQSLIPPFRLLASAFFSVAAAGVVFFMSVQAGVGVSAVALVLMFLGGLSGGASFALIPYLSHDKWFQVRANGALAQLANVGSTVGPPLFAGAISHFGVQGLVLPLVCFALSGVCVVLCAVRYLHRHAE
ncbi:hypothetical protein DTO96_102360 [Ephemeroptericola cinctiostellae]|uniref:Major facilitator superfamily (MFS) profile domain-containing protein n=1 Tax=Ephemeroptericola cinctiostellae TaxID=2268024 RepID=A0A345DE17_9BURK|nr:MFS transporter [Ephemeroptericola cinctiostellae]AXF86605.1 hypothetical protein DTO96_102360 [Ephemeroptericola cinctiostellae]